MDKDNVYNLNGTKVNYDYAVEMMDDEIREELHGEISPCSNQEFFTAYEHKHYLKYGELWEFSKENPTT